VDESPALGLLTLWLGLLIAGGALLFRRRWVFGALFIVESLAALVVAYLLAVTPIGIGATLLRIPQGAFASLFASAVVLVVAGAAALWIYSRRGGHLAWPRSRRSFVAVVALVPLISAVGLYVISYANTPERERERDAARRVITLPPGFATSVFLQGTIDNPTAMAFGPDGRLYVADIGGTVWVGSDDDGDHKVDRVTRFADGFNLLVGLLWLRDELFVSSSGRIEALRDTDGDDRADERRIVADGLPSMILVPHSNNALTLGPDGRIYFGVGATDREREANPLGSAILSVSPDGGDVRVFARGFGNPFKLAFNSLGDMFAGDNSLAAPDGEVPPDKLNHVVEGGEYGFPIGERTLLSSPSRDPVAMLPPSSVPTGLAIYNGGTYPDDYADNAFLALWNRGEVVRAELFDDGRGEYGASTSVFGSGFLYPIDIVVGPDGNLYVADFGTSVVYRITYDRS
jgi:glucose/arabinose dehydrogenase